MTHVSDAILRTRLDGELAASDAPPVEEHLQACAACRLRAESMAASAQQIDALLLEQPPPDSAAAYMRLQARLRSAAPAKPRLWSRVPVWGAVAAAAAVVLVVSGSPGAIAQKLLSVFRVKSVVAVPLQNDFLADGKGRLLGDLLADSVTVTTDEKAVAVTSREEASRLAGFAVRLPGIRQDAPSSFRVEGRRAFYLTVNRQRVESFLQLVNRADIRLPDTLNGAKVIVETPRYVVTAYGDCPKLPGPAPDPARFLNCLAVIQAPSATVSTMPELNLAELAEIGLQVSGMTAEEARSFSSTIDWTSTLAIPIPREASSYQNVIVDGQKGVLVVGRQYSNLPTRWSLIWVNQERIYSVSGFGNPQLALNVAESLR